MVPSPLESDVRVAEEKTKNQVCECGGKELLKKKKGGRETKLPDWRQGVTHLIVLAWCKEGDKDREREDQMQGT